MLKRDGKSFQRRLLLSTIFLAQMAVGIINYLPGAILPALALHTSVSLGSIGWIFTGNALGTLLGSMLAGGLTKRLEAKHILIIGLVLMGISTSIISWAPLFSVLFLAEFVQGLGFGLCNVGFNMVIMMAFRDSLSSTFNMLYSAFGIGALLGPFLLSLVLAVLHEPLWAFLVSPALILLVVILLFKQSISADPSAQGQLPAASSETRVVLLQSGFWLAFLQIFLYVGAELSFGNWIVTAVSQKAALPLAFAAPVATIFFLGLTCGRILSAQGLKKGRVQERSLLYTCFVGGGLSILTVAVFPGYLWLSFSATFLVGLCCGPVFPGLAALASARFAKAQGLVSSMISVSSGVSGLIFPVLVGAVFTHAGIGWGLSVPALLIWAVLLPFSLARTQQPKQDLFGRQKLS
ncbi:MFS transporter [Ktedonosporobacter rubrisoli]|uniref:MFS transporter n=1 Tax=Ktedonosporobacter rubrisoli TaxID=2509675 RepID=A0A4P6JK72_KTERU|nr:MFS transporter [Ktedonosporobacter rubrisoli]QBD75362.1 MFS transporter [Ktedonosporobacter rubrisoli]